MPSSRIRCLARARSWSAVIGVIASAVLVTSAAAGASTGGGGTRGLRGFVLDPAPQVGDRSLPDVGNGGRELAFVASPGRLLLVYFGYTACPDICPTTLNDLAVALRKAGRAADGVEVAMVTVDPGRDTAEVLSSYLAHFLAGRAHALRTEDPGRLRVVADAFGAKYEVKTYADGSEDVGHSAFVYAVDDTGTIRVVWPFGTPPSAVAHDLRRLRASARG